MTSRQTTIQHKQTAGSASECIVMTALSWSPSSNIANLFERGYNDPGKRVLEVTSM